jgi:hypothetical protein
MNGRTFTLNLMNWGYDISFNEEELQSFDDEDLDWFKKEMGLSRDSLFRIFDRAKEIVGQFKPNDEFLSFTYDTDIGNWYIHFDPPDANENRMPTNIPTDTRGRWHVHVYRHEEHLKEEVSEGCEVIPFPG